MKTINLQLTIPRQLAKSPILDKENLLQFNSNLFCIGDTPISVTWQRWYEDTEVMEFGIYRLCTPEELPKLLPKVLLEPLGEGECIIVPVNDTMNIRARATSKGGGYAGQFSRQVQCVGDPNM